MDTLSADVLRGQFYAEGACGEATNFVLNVGGIVGEFVAELTGDFDDLGFVLDDFRLTKDDHAAKIQCPAPFFGSAGIHHTVGYLAAISDGVQLVPDFAAVEVQLAVFFAVPVIDG